MTGSEKLFQKIYYSDKVISELIISEDIYQKLIDESIFGSLLKTEFEKENPVYIGEIKEVAIYVDRDLEPNTIIEI